MQKFAVLLAASSALALAGCAKQPPPDIPLPPVQATPTPAPAPAPAPAPTPAGPVAGSQAHFSQVMSGRDVIFFDTDKYNIDSQDAASLRTQAEYLLQYSNTRATVEGHADERGTRDYNLALGERRANSARNYLISLGVAENRLRTVSYGEERPAATGSNESAWAQNRRAVTVMID